MRTLFVCTLTSNNQVTIPDCICKRLGLETGDSVAFELRNDLVYLQKAWPVDYAMTRAVGKTLQDEWSSRHDEQAYRNL